MMIKKGMKVYQIHYWENNRTLEEGIVKKVDERGTIIECRGLDIFIRKDKTGIGWFISEEKAVKASIKLNEKILKDYCGEKEFDEEKQKIGIKSLKELLKEIQDSATSCKEEKKC